MKAIVIDDDDVIVEVIKNSVDWNKLEIEEVFYAYNAETGRKLISENRVDIIISDIEMPKESGLELLQWYYDTGVSGKFILLTCHESFSYAIKAMELQAADYLLKPFNVEIMEMVLKKNIDLLKKERQTKEKAAYGQWVIENVGAMKLQFFEGLMNGRIQNSMDVIQQNIRIRNLDIDIASEYRMVISQIADMETDADQYGNESLEYMIRNLHNELLLEYPQTERVICYGREANCTVITICNKEESEVIKERCEKLIRKCAEMFEFTITICIGNLCKLDEFRKSCRSIMDKIGKNVIFYGQPFFEAEVIDNNEAIDSVLDMDKLKVLLEEHEQVHVMEYLRRELDARAKLKVLDGKRLNIAKWEFQQAVYSHMMGQGIVISRILQEKDFMVISDKADKSVLDFLRWSSYLLNQSYLLEAELQKSQDTIEKINQYIREHYREKIGRNEIGQKFHMAPVYLAKIYKKKTGKTLKEYLNEYRIEQAKRLLRNTDMHIIDIAMQTGFDNISYFSTIFKKITECSPNDYRKQQQIP